MNTELIVYKTEYKTSEKLVKFDPKYFWFVTKFSFIIM